MSTLYVDVQPLELELAVGDHGVVEVSITNSSPRIDGYRLRLYGLDPEWVTVTPARIAVFPGETATAQIDLAMPVEYPAGHRQITIQVQSENDPDDFTLVQMTVNVGRQPYARLKVDPISVYGGRRATFNLVVFNEGNTPIHAVPEAVDPEETATFQFKPASVDINPGRRETLEVRVEGKRPWLGTPKARVLMFAVTTPDRLEGVASFVQRPKIGRWLLSLMGLIAAAAIFASVLSYAFESVVDEASVDENVLNKALDEGEAGGTEIPLNPASITGKVSSLSSPGGLSGVQADLFLAGDTVKPLYTASTTDDGTFAFGRLAGGSQNKYKLRLSGAGFADIWYPEAALAADAEEIELEDGTPKELKEVKIGGRPGSVSGRVIIDDTKGVVATLSLQGQIDPDAAEEAVVQTVKVGADGAFAFENVPTPNQYHLLVDKPGFAQERRTIDLQPAQVMSAIEITMRRGDGTVVGEVTSPDGSPLGGVAVEATDGTTVISTVSLTRDAPGTFVLRGLPTPAIYTITVRLDGYTSASRTVTLGQGETLLDLSFALLRATGTIRGAVSLDGAGPLGGVAVTVTGGDVEVSTTTISQGDDIGTYVIEGLPIPATYTVSFARPDLVSQVRLQDLDPLNGTADVPALDAVMIRATATVKGVVRRADGGLAGSAKVELNDGDTIRTLYTANFPAGEDGDEGRFEFAGVPPGTYTLTASLKGTTPSVVLVNVTAAEVQSVDIPLAPQASFVGTVLSCEVGPINCVPLAEARVRIFLVGDFPGSAALAVGDVLTDENGRYRFPELDAPEDYVIAVYVNDITTNPLDSKLVVTQPSQELEVASFELVP